jgi:phosphate regulon sensor kinase PhoR
MRRKLLLSFLIVLFTGVLLTGFLSAGYIRNYYVSSTEEKLASNGGLISNDFIKEHQSGKESYDDQAKAYSKLSNARITIIASNGRVIGESDRDSSSMENHSQRPEVIKALAGGIGKDSRFSTTENREMMYVAVPIKNGMDIIGVVRLSVPFVEINKMQNYLLRYILISIFIGLLGTSAIAYTIVGNIVKPINEMTDVSLEIAGGRYDKRINVKAKDEIGKLSESFNNMAEKLEITISDLSDKKIKLEAILESMQSGVIAVDNGGRIMLANPAAVDIFGLSGDIVGRHILEVIRNMELEEIIREHKDETNEVSINFPEKRILRVKAAPIRDSISNDNSYGTVVVIQDITELKQLEQMRSDFVANVSHELKTPLTSIKGFTETLKDGAINDDAAREKFLDIISIEADRLNRLITDILTISELENKKQNLSFEKVNVNKCIDEIMDIMNSLAQQKDIKLSFNRDMSLPNILGIHDKVKQLLINLIDNGIKYTPNGGKVDIETYYKEKNVYIKVSDNGIGIPKEHIPRLFERFYRVDKGRSRSLGGTGLGLAIVKHIIANMNGSIEVDSQPGKGTTFTIIVPEA